MLKIRVELRQRLGIDGGIEVRVKLISQLQLGNLAKNWIEDKGM
jgi:hypothetical protein